jgi:hypothetical protein
MVFVKRAVQPWWLPAMQALVLFSVRSLVVLVHHLLYWLATSLLANVRQLVLLQDFSQHHNIQPWNY